ncbi:MAG: hypothetical protein IPP31_09860 [Chitinophagaceae bacterium]|nr:hypothetical protein [Chitinophagaceae bacterium]
MRLRHDPDIIGKEGACFRCLLSLIQTLITVLYAKILFTLTFPFARAFANAQQELAEKWWRPWIIFYLRPQERAYIQTDRESVYGRGDDLVKAYALLNGKSTILSKII